MPSPQRRDGADIVVPAGRPHAFSPNGQDEPSAREWLRHAQWLTYEHIQYFDDWVDLFEKLLSVDLVAVSRRMEAHNRERASVIAQSWEAVFDRVQALAPRPPANAIPCTCVAGSAERPQRRREREPSACCGRGGACSPARYSPSPTPHPLFYSRPPTHPHPTPNCTLPSRAGGAARGRRSARHPARLRSGHGRAVRAHRPARCLPKRPSVPRPVLAERKVNPPEQRTQGDRALCG